MYKHKDPNLYFTNPDEIHWKPGAKTKDKTKTLLMPYGEVRDYQRRLDIIDADWQSFITVTCSGERVICSVELLVNGVSRTSTGDALLIERDEPSALAGTNAEAQAFKRACSAHNVGRELYYTAPVWVPSEDAMDYVWGKKRAALTFEGPYSFLNTEKKKSGKKAKVTAPELPKDNRPWSDKQKNALIKAKLAKNEFAARGMLGLSSLPIEATVKEIVEWGTEYRKHRAPDGEMLAVPAAQEANRIILGIS